MNTKTIYLIIGLLLAIIVGMGLFTFIAKKSLPDESVVATTTNPIQVSNENPYGIERIDAKYFYRDGTHILVGSIVLPTPCDLLESSARVSETIPEQISFDFTVINTAEACAQMMTEQRFRVEAVASQSATFKATFMGKPVDLNLTEGLPSETPEDFELFIKG